MLRERHVGIGAVHRTGGRKHQMPHAVMPAALEDVQEAGDIAVHVHMRIGGGVAHAGLRGQMHDTIGLVRREQVFNRLAVGQVGGDVGVGRMVLEAREPRLLQGHVVVVVEVVEADDFVTAGQEDLGYVGADEARSSGD